MIEWFTRNHVAANLLMLSIVVAGIYSISRLLPLESQPSFEADIVTISVTRRAANPEDMETGITSRIEQAISNLPSIKKITSRSGEGRSTVTAELIRGENKQKALNDIKARVDALNTLPGDAERPVIQIPVRVRDVLSVVIFGDLDEKELSSVANQLRDDLVLQPGISQAEIEGIRSYELSIEAPEARLREYGLTLADLANTIKGQAMDLSAGSIHSSNGEILLRAKGQAYNHNQFADITLQRFPDGSSLKLTDIATIQDGFSEDIIITRYDGKPAAVINVGRTGKESVIGVAAAVKDYLAQSRHRYPPTVQFAVWGDTSRHIKDRLGTLSSNMIQGALLVLALLTLFLHPSIALWVVVGIPVCFMGATALMPMLGLTINSLSLFGFILVLGIVVDDAIVTGENIYRHYRRHEDGTLAAINGTREVTVPVVFGVLTTITAFLPLPFVPGGMGSYFGSMAMVVIAVLAFSLIESKLILPSHLKYLKDPQPGSYKYRLLMLQQRLANRLEEAILNHYRPLLKSLIKQRYLVVIGFVATAIITHSLFSNGWVRYAFSPQVENETVTATLSMQKGTPIEKTRAAMLHLEKTAMALREKYRNSETGDSPIDNILNTIGAAGGRNTGGSDTGRIRFSLKPREERNTEFSTAQLISEWRQMIGPIAGLDKLYISAQYNPSGRPIDIQITGQQTELLREVAMQVKGQLSSYSGVFNIGDNLGNGKRELLIQLKPEGELLGFNLEQITRQVREAFYGNQAQRIQRGPDDLRIMVRYPKQERGSLNNLEELLLTTQSGAEARFSDIATLSWGLSSTEINHANSQRAVNITADYNKDTVNGSALMSDITAYLDTQMANYPSLRYSLEGEAAEQRETSRAMLIGLCLVIFIIYALLAIPFGSYTQPFIVLSVVPFALIGAVFGHLIMGHNLSILSLMGMLALIGIIINDSLVLVDYVNKQIKQGAVLKDAILGAGVIRFRPILLTSLTTFVGLLPILAEQSTQAQYLIPMAISIAFGILFGTVITLILIPCHYLILEDIKALFSKRTITNSAQAT